MVPLILYDFPQFHTILYIEQRGLCTLMVLIQSVVADPLA